MCKELMTLRFGCACRSNIVELESYGKQNHERMYVDNNSVEKSQQINKKVVAPDQMGVRSTFSVKTWSQETETHQPHNVDSDSDKLI